MIYGSVCSGVEAASVAWEPLGWEPAWFCEFDKFPSAVLAHHYPNVPNIGDMTKIEANGEFNDRSIDLLVGGTPCQSFSIAGLRKGLDDDRGNLALKFCQILKVKQPRWFVWENVPGVLSSNGGRDFAAILSGFRECGYGFAYRVLDAQYFGVPQRRRRVFVVGHLGNWQAAAAVLFERESLYGHPPPRREAKQRVAGTIAAGSFTGGAGGRPEGAAAGHFQPVTKNGSHWDGQAHPSLSQSHNTGGIGQSNQELFSQRGAGLVAASHDPAATLQTSCDDYSRADGFNMIAVHGTQDPDCNVDMAHTLGRNNGQENAICYAAKLNHTGSNCIGIDTELGYTLDATETCGQAVACFKAGQGAKAGGIGYEEEMAPTLTASDSGTQQSPALLRDCAVRRLTPIECEFLQGFPRNYTQIPWRGKDAQHCPDGPRYKAMGNSMAVPVMSWIGQRIDAVDKIVRGVE